MVAMTLTNKKGVGTREQTHPVIKIGHGYGHQEQFPSSFFDLLAPSHPRSSWGSCGEPCGDLPWSLGWEGRMSHTDQAIESLNLDCVAIRLQFQRAFYLNSPEGLNYIILN